MLATIWEHPEIDVSALPTEIRMSLGKLEALAEEATRERRTYLAKEPDPEPLSRTLVRLHTDISTLGRILTKPLPEAVHQHLTEPWSRVARAATHVLRHTSLALPARRSPLTLDPVIEAIAAYEAAVDGIRRTGITKDLPNEAVGCVFALGFVLEQFQRNLRDLLSRTREAQGADT